MAPMTAVPRTRGGGRSRRSGKFSALRAAILDAQGKHKTIRLPRPAQRPSLRRSGQTHFWQGRNMKMYRKGVKFTSEKVTCVHPRHKTFQISDFPLNFCFRVGTAARSGPFGSGWYLATPAPSESAFWRARTRCFRELFPLWREYWLTGWREQPGCPAREPSGRSGPWGCWGCLEKVLRQD